MNSLDVSSRLSNQFPATTDPLEQMAREDRDDWVLLRLVVCVAVATLAMAVASTLPM